MTEEFRFAAVPAVLYVGTDASGRSLVERALGQAGFACRSVAGKEQALDALARQSFAACLIDLAGDGEAIRTVRAIRAGDPQAIVIAVADPARPDVMEQAIQAGVLDVIPRPVRAHEIERLVVHALESASVIDENAPGARPCSVELVGSSLAVRQVTDAVKRAARVRASVLVVVERGMDAEAVARGIHAAGRHAAGPFVRVGCANAEPGGVERDLFGVRTRREAFDLEVVNGDSRIADARGGTLFLADVGDLPASAQARLARMARDGEMRVEGRAEVVPFDIRLMASSTVGLDDEVRQGRFRLDLFRRLGALRIEVPPLGQRAEDIPLLARYLVREACTLAGVPAKSFTQAALTLLAALPWHGNTRELKEVLERLVLSVAGAMIRLEDVLTHVRLDGSPPPLVPGGTLRAMRRRFEREYITAVLRQHRGRMSEAARALGIQRANLYRKVRQLGISRVEPPGAVAGGRLRSS